MTVFYQFLLVEIPFDPNEILLLKIMTLAWLPSLAEESNQPGLMRPALPSYHLIKRAGQLKSKKYEIL